jgi:hypothetical protein
MVGPRQRSTLVVIISCCFSGFVGCGTRFQSDLGVSCVADSGDRERVFMKFGAPDKIEYPDNRPRPKEEGEGVESPSRSGSMLTWTESETT